MVRFEEPPRFVIILAGEQTGPQDARAAGPFETFDQAQAFLNAARVEHEDIDELVVVQLEATDDPSAFAVGDR